MTTSSRPMKTLSAILVAAGALFLISSFIPGLYLNLAWPAIFFVGAAGVFMLLNALKPRSRWWALLYLPALLLMAVGLVFLYSTVSKDWVAWAYAWLFPVAALGLGMVLAAREGVHGGRWLPDLPRVGFWTASGGLALFTLLALIIGGPGMRAFAAVIVIAAGGLLYWQMSYGALPAPLRRLLVEYAILPGDDAAPQAALPAVPPTGEQRGETAAHAPASQSGGGAATLAAEPPGSSTAASSAAESPAPSSTMDAPDAAKAAPSTAQTSSMQSTPAASASAASASAASASSPQPAALVEPLSEREMQVLHLIARGLTNDEIAAQLVVAQSTVKTHINNLYAKLGVKTRVQALNRARELNLIS